MELKQAAMSEIMDGTDSVRPFGARVECDPVEMTVRYKLRTYKFQTESVAVQFAAELCAYPFEDQAWREGPETYGRPA